jgi:hypothetical protein
MLANTGTVSFILYGVFILIAIAAMVVAFWIINKGSIESAKLDKMIELFKYVVVSTAIATVSLIVTDLFKEREQDVKELEYFDKYVADVKNIDGIQQRLQLAKYLSIVAPSGEMKKSWKEYYDTVKSEYAEYVKLKTEHARDSVATKTPEQKVIYDQQAKQIRLYEGPLDASEKKAIKTSDFTSAQMWEEKGFAFLLNKDVENAIEAFRNSENAANGYHMVYDIAKYLNENKSKLSNSNAEFWKTAYKKISTDFSWKMPSETKSKLMQSAK